ncbi:hypothetical protein AAF712_014034 [Marasmius tenuissimus]|uniref:Uncharacterized protein n=1 Tax=Marasmius tenuissimus TaxID=585030 RepID=A0ABR2ZC52_9AGAR
MLTELINSLHCVRYPFPQSSFYWSSDLYGRNKIPKEDWERLGIPKLRVQQFIGSYWDDMESQTVRELLHQKDYDLDGKQYARDRGYPELILGEYHFPPWVSTSVTLFPGDPHDTVRFQELESPESHLEPKTSPSPSRLTSPSTYSLVEAPLEPRLKPEDAPKTPPPKEIMVTPTRWVRGFLKKYCMFLCSRPVLEIYLTKPSRQVAR